MRGQVSPLVLQRRAARKARIDAVKALNIKPGEWIVKRGKTRRAWTSDLNARDNDFQQIRRATRAEIKAAELAEAEVQAHREAYEKHKQRPDVRDAQTILACSEEELLAVGPELLAQVAGKLRA